MEKISIEKINKENGLAQETERNRSIRLKVTERCPWECTFCHKEGGWGIDDIHWTQDIKDSISLLKSKLDLEEIHLTGGEPTALGNIDELALGLTALGLEVKTTTNGQFSKEKLTRLFDSGLRSYNFSVHALSADEFVKTQRRKDLPWAKESIDRQIRMILAAKDIGANVKINSVMSGMDDLRRIESIYSFAKDQQIGIRILNDLGSGSDAIEALRYFSENMLGARKIKERIIIGSSSKTSFYEDRDGYYFGIKEIRKHKLDSLCADCKDRCTEQFYGIRLEQRDGKLMVRLCIDRQDGKSVMSLEKFLESPQIEEIINLIS